MWLTFDQGTEQQECKGFPPLKIRKVRTKQPKKEIVLSSSTFWDKNDSMDQKIRNFTLALNNIKSKEELNVIDQRLLNVMN